MSKGLLNTLIAFGFLLLILNLPLPPFEFNYYVNLTNSAPIGLYKKVNSQNYSKGDLVVFELPEEIKQQLQDRLWYKNTTLLKSIEGLTGDSYYAKDNVYFVNDIPCGTIAVADMQGKNLPHIQEGKHIVRKDHFLATSLHQKNAFDSRYYGDISFDNIKSKVIPYLILKNNKEG